VNALGLADTGEAEDETPASMISANTPTFLPHALSASIGGLDRSDVNLFHLHHRIERALGDGGIGFRYRFD
jgi:hypothetical protein